MKAVIDTARSDYLPWDQEKHLGKQPWSGDSLTEWEKAHGHDVRIKCFPEYGCLVTEAGALAPHIDHAEKVLERHVPYLLPVEYECRGCHDRWPCPDIRDLAIAWGCSDE
jgi:hypothetical protein